MNMKQAFIHWYNNEFKLDSLYLAMEATVEDSPWHRERNVGVHTDMVVSEFLSSSTLGFSLIGALVCAFHDVGKPGAMKMKWTEERGHYKQFGGHEQVSARLWEAYAVANWKSLVEKFNLAPYDIYRVAVMIEHHVPWGLRDKRKLDAVLLTMGEVGDLDVFSNILLADTYGRISDDAEQKQKNSAEWLDKEVMSRIGWNWKMGSPDNEKVVYFPIGPSGCGKSSMFRNQGFADVSHFSLDALRHKWYHETDYGYAFEQSCKDKGFIHKAQKEYQQMLRDGVSEVFVDNTNTTRKTRRFWVTEAKNRGYKTMAYLFPSDVETLVARQEDREDKTVPSEAVRRQYNQVQMPLYYGEFDVIAVMSGNLPA